MKYETPEVTVLMLAINALQAGGGSKVDQTNPEGLPHNKEEIAGYTDWE